MFDIIKKLYKLISFCGSVKKLNLLLLLTTLSAIVETFGIALMFPFIAILSVPNYVEHSVFLSKIYHYFNFTNQNHFMLMIGISLLLVVIFGNLLVAFSLYALYRFSHSQEHNLSTAMLKKYLSRPYVFFLTQNSNVLLKNIVNEAETVAGGVLASVLKIGAKLSVIVTMLLFLLIYNPLLTSIITVSVLSLYGFFILFFKDYMSKKSNENITAGRLKYKYVSESLNAIQDVKLMNLSSFILARYSQPSATSALSRSMSSVVADTPRYLLDIIIFGGILLYIVIMLFNNDPNLTRIMPTLAMFGYAGIRIMPSVSLMYHSYSVAKFAKPSLDVLYDNLFSENIYDQNTAKKNQSNLPIYFTKELRFENVCYAYPEAHKNIINNLNVVIPAFTKVGFVGKTGAGKTTIINLILGLLSPTAGYIKIDNDTLDDNRMIAWQSGIGYVSQSIYLIDDTIAQNIAFGSEQSEIDWDRLKAVAKEVELHDFIMQELPNQYETQVGDRGVRLSGGQRQRVGIARALYRRPKLLVLDEATSALDNVTEKKVLENINKISNKITVIMVAHRLSTLQHCDNIYVLTANGIPSSGTYDWLSRHCDIFRSFLQANTHSSVEIVNDQENPYA